MVRRGQYAVQTNPETDSLSSLGSGHGDIIEAYFSGTWPTASTEMPDKRWDDLSGSDPGDSDDDCASMETEKAYHGILSVYNGLDPDAEMLLRFNKYKARRHEKSEADKGRLGRCEQQERVFAVRAQYALAPTPVAERAAANLAFVTLTIG